MRVGNVQNVFWGGLCSVITGIENGCDRAQPSNLGKDILHMVVQNEVGRCPKWFGEGYAHSYQVKEF